MAAVSPEAKRKQAEYSRAWYQRNKERVKVRTREWTKMNRVKKKAATDRWHAENKDKIRESRKSKYDIAKAKRIWLLNRYGLSEDQFNLMLIQQKNRCAVCRDSFSDANKPFVDHCHNTNMVRGLVCSKCNKAEGFLRNPNNARRMYEYMLKFELCYGGKN